MTDKQISPSIDENPPAASGGDQHLAEAASDEVVLYCANHPTVETSLRCSRCEKPICAKCAVATPTGYKCKQCISGQQKVFSTTRWYDYPLAFLIAAALALIGSLLVTWVIRIFIFLVIFVGPAAGMVIAEAVRIALSRRRSPRLWQVMAAGIIVGGLPLLFGALLSLNLWSILAQGFYLFTAVTSAIARLRGINIR